jgi:hypothetical protein
MPYTYPAAAGDPAMTTAFGYPAALGDPVMTASVTSTPGGGAAAPTTGQLWPRGNKS